MSGQLPRCPLNFEIVLTLCQYTSEKFHTLPSQTWFTTLVNMGSGGSVITLCNCLYTNICNIFSSFSFDDLQKYLISIMAHFIDTYLLSDSKEQVAYHK